MDTDFTKNLPTDNLYKFIAIFGLAIFVLAFFIPDYYNKKIISNREYLRGEGGYYESGINKSIENSISSQKNIDRSRQELFDMLHENLQYSGNDKAKYDETMEAYKKQYDGITNDYNELIASMELAYSGINDFNKAVILKDRGDTENLKREAELVTKICLVVGFISIVFGFTCWYYKTQRYLDWILRERGEKFRPKGIFKAIKEDLVLFYRFLFKRR